MDVLPPARILRMTARLAPASSQSKLDSGKPYLFCFSHLRWSFVYQRPQHFMSRAAAGYQVLFWEEPEYADAQALRISIARPGVTVAVPLLRHGTSAEAGVRIQQRLLDSLIRERGIEPAVLWYYTPNALRFSRRLKGRVTVYDCMDELSAFRFADPALPTLEQELLARADLVFTGGFSLYEAKHQKHRSVHLFPSAVDAAHFRPARGRLAEPLDQTSIPRPRLGFYGVIDERMDLALLAGVADARPDWQLVLIGPIVKIDPAELPNRPNIHYLGQKTYDELPSYIAGWGAALMPFARNEATRFINPTKTPEYLAAGRAVVSTPIIDVVRQYGSTTFVKIAEDVATFVEAAEEALALGREPHIWLPNADQMLSGISWDSSWGRMSTLIDEQAGSGREFVHSLPLARFAIGGPAKACDDLVVGAGFAGCVMAERLASAGRKVVVIDRRPHFGGNAYDFTDEAGILVHRYGPHIFHTNSQRIVDYLSRYTAWRPYEHRALAQVGGALLPVPINRQTINGFFDLDLAASEAEAFLATKAEPIETIRTSADVVLSRVGRELYEAFFRGYTRKQWGMDPADLDKSVTSRIPARTNDDDRYFTDKFQIMPRHGYTRLFENMLDHRNISLALGLDYRDAIGEIEFENLIYTGPIDEFFEYRFGKLPYRSLQFRHETIDRERHQPVGVINYPSEHVPYTRITEFKHLTGQTHAQTSICYEYPSDIGDPYYPVPRSENHALYARYQALAETARGVTFVGRLATYRYYNMDQIVGQALSTFDRLRGSGLLARAAVGGISTLALPAAQGPER